MRFCRRGLWLRQAGQGRLIEWKALLPIILFPLAFLLFNVAAVQRQEPLVEWCLYSLIRDDPRGLEVAREIFREQNRSALAAVLNNPQPPTGSTVPVYQVFTADSGLDTMIRALHTGDPGKRHEPGGDRPYQPAYLVEDQTVARCQVALRGFGHWHHAPEKPSLRVKVRNPDKVGRRYLDLQRPEGALAMTNWLVGRMAGQIGLMSQQVDHVAVYFNHRFLGLYDRTYRCGGLLALAEGRRPGTFFKGDIVLPGGVVGAPGRSLWTGLEEWDLFGLDDPVARQRFLKLLELVESSASAERLGHYLDLDAMARYSALMAFVASAHTDVNHNQVFFYDPSRGLFEPVIWDPNGFGVHLPANAPLDLLANPVEKVLYQDQDWRALRAHHLKRLAASRPEVLAEEELQRIRPWLEADPALSSLVTTELGVNRLKRFAASDLPRLERELEAFIQTRRRLSLSYLESQPEWEPTEPATSVLSGETVVSQDRVYEGDLTIEPGTHLRLEAGVSLVVKGKLQARGTPQAPIRVSPVGKASRTFGSIAVQGGPASLSHWEVEGGGGDSVEGVFCRGGLSFNNSQVELSDCEFRDCLVAFVGSRGTVERCRFRGFFREPLLVQDSSLQVSGCSSERVLKPDSLKGPAIGTPARVEREFKQNLLGVEATSGERLAESIREALSVPSDEWSAPSLTSFAYRVDERAKDFLYRDIYFDTSDQRNRQNSISYRLRTRYRSWKSYRQHLARPEWSDYWPFRIEFQAKTGRQELGQGFSTVIESRLEFRTESSPFSLEEPPPPPPWKEAEFLSYFESGRYRGEVTEPAHHMATAYPDQPEFRPQLLLLTERTRLHLNMKTEFGSGPNPEQVFIISLDRCRVLPAGLTPQQERAYDSSRSEFWELEVEFERNTSELLDQRIQQAEEPGEKERLEKIRAAFLADQKTVVTLATEKLAGLGIKVVPAIQSKYVTACQKR